MAVDYFDSPAGLLRIEADTEAILSISFVENAGVINPNFLTDKCKTQLKEYFLHKRKKFDLPLKFGGTEFMQQVWIATEAVPYGQTITYGALAASIGRPKSYRAVANALGRNRHVIVIPCHRVVAAGSLGGFSAGLDKKIFLLKHESDTLAQD